MVYFSCFSNTRFRTCCVLALNNELRNPFNYIFFQSFDLLVSCICFTGYWLNISSCAVLLDVLFEDDVSESYLGVDTLSSAQSSSVLVRRLRVCSFD